MYLQIMCCAAPYEPHQSADAGDCDTAVNPKPLYKPRTPSACTTLRITSNGPLQYVVPGRP